MHNLMGWFRPLFYSFLHLCGEQATSTILTYAINKLRRVAHVQLFTCCDGTVTLRLSGAPILLTSLVLGGPNPVHDTL